MPKPRTIILYHGGCPDGFGGAYSAWKKFGDDAEYIPLYRSHPVPEGLDGCNLYFIDFCYPKEIMETFRKTAQSVIVLDHHEGASETALSFEGVFDQNHSGAVIAWNYFHKEKPVPKLLSYIEDGDLYRFALPHSREILSSIYSEPWESFEYFDSTIEKMKDPSKLEQMATIGAHYIKYRQSIINSHVKKAELVLFEGYECYLASSTGEFTSDVGHALAEKKPPIALIVSADALGLRISLRSDGSVDVSKLAQIYGGNGHPAASGIRIPFGAPIPWKIIPKDEKDEVTGD